MGWLRKLFSATPEEELEGLELSPSENHWEIDGPETFEGILNALIDWVPDGSILYFEGGSPDDEIKNFLTKHSIPEVSRIAKGTVWPRPDVYHVPAVKPVITELAKIMRRHAEWELADHFHVYRDNEMLFQWHDAFSDPILISSVFPEEEVKALAEKFGSKNRRVRDDESDL